MTPPTPQPAPSADTNMMPPDAVKSDAKIKPRPQLKLAEEPSMFHLSVKGVDIIHTTRHSMAKGLYILLAVAAFFDFCATVLADFVPKQEDEFITIQKHTRNQVVIDTDDPLVYSFLKFLDRWFVYIGMMFSILWFLCAFVRAQWVRDKRLRELDRKRLLDENVLDAKTFRQDVKEFEGAWDAYYWTIILQLLLLPVGFYICLWSILRRIMDPSAVSPEDVVEVDVVYTGDDGTPTESVEHRFTTHSTHCLLVALLHYCAVVIKQTTGVQLEYSTAIVKRKVIRRVLGAAIRHPKRFVHRLRQAQTGIRWFKYLAPLIGTGNKLLGNVKDLINKERQYLYAKRARRIRKQFWKLMSVKERREAAAIRIQKCYRAMCARKAFRALQLMQGTRESIAAIRVQSAFRAALARARTTLLLKEQELDRLQAEAVANGDGPTANMSVDDRRRMYILENELKSTANKLVNEKMLLRPNTSFAVTWKVLFVICVVFEITQLALKPKLDKFIDKDTGKRLDIGKILDHKLVPTPITEWEECAAWLIDDEQLEKETRGFFQKRRKRRKEKEAKKLKRPWFCKEPFVTAQSMYISVLRFMLTQTLLIIAIVCYFDVFVTFFTGIFDSETGVLEPKPFFTRWVIPGLTLQLLVNPRMETTSQYVFQVLSDAWTIGPIRVYRWSKALFFPLFILCSSAVQRWVWEPFVKRENKRILQK